MLYSKYRLKFDSPTDLAAVDARGHGLVGIREGSVILIPSRANLNRIQGPLLYGNRTPMITATALAASASCVR